MTLGEFSRQYAAKRKGSMTQTDIVQNYVNGVWQDSTASESLDVNDPATAEVLARVPLSPPEEVNQAALAAAAAFQEWRH
jgi:malonate-semialdehyde dehydrogenase (acetylating)/methylmalonate-semialdehyde dehydrogenase